jgi:hypothetical protein
MAGSIELSSRNFLKELGNWLRSNVEEGTSSSLSSVINLNKELKKKRTRKKIFNELKICYSMQNRETWVP